jgi:hypothetical protein
VDEVARVAQHQPVTADFGERLVPEGGCHDRGDCPEGDRCLHDGGVHPSGLPGLTRIYS